MLLHPGRPALLALIALLAACSSATTAPMRPTPADTTPPPLTREMRGLWVATVGNIDWPSRSTLSAEQQRAELIDILDRAQTAGFNAIVLQVRPAADAVYASSLEPWAALLTGQQGLDPGYDPLAFAIEQAHARGLELHAWINPFRAGNTRDTLVLAPTHSYTVRRDVVRVYGSQLWLDPGEPAVQEHSMAVVRDIVQRYDIDGIHADDYFYPYQQFDASGRLIPFPDSGSFARSGSTLSRDDWRRANVDRFVARMYREVHELKPTVKVGLSPFGIWRPGHPAGVNGLDAYATIYADSRRWLQEGWLDYFAPQLYWAIGAPQQSFPALLDWWLAQNPLGRHVWPGLAAYRVSDGTTNEFSTEEIPAQIRLIRVRPAAQGYLLYNTTSTLKRNAAAVAESVKPLHPVRAILPAFPWLDALPPPPPLLTVTGRTVAITPGEGELPRWWHLRVRIDRVWTTNVLFVDQRSITLPGEAERIIAHAIDMAGNASTPYFWSASSP